ncbi:hypothetical protein LSUE1_G003179, partial [Lachnellula suecica]
MPAHPTPSLARHGMLSIRGARHASSAPLPQDPPTIELGRQIFVYNHLQRNHVVYSLTKALKNNKALRQIPYNGKKTVPRALRKDLWAPLATLTFPSAPIGLSTLQKLREFRRRHELEKAKWQEGDSHARRRNLKVYNRDEEEEERKKKIKERLEVLVDQKANSVADIAYVLGKLDFVGVKREELVPAKE